MGGGIRAYTGNLLGTGCRPSWITSCADRIVIFAVPVSHPLTASAAHYVLHANAVFTINTGGAWRKQIISFTGLGPDGRQNVVHTWKVWLILVLPLQAGPIVHSVCNQFAAFARSVFPLRLRR